MVKRITYYLFIGFFVQNLNAQIVNVESLRLKTDTLGWAGSAHLSINLKKSVNEQFKIKSGIHVQYKFPKHLILFVNNIGFERIDDADFTNDAMQHLRYNYKFNKTITGELFLQNQNNAIAKIEYRRLIGSGIRIKLSQSDKYKFYLGNHLMYENEKSKEENPKTNFDWRNSTYFSFSLYLNDNIKLISTTYFQPRLDKFSDYRTSHQSELNIKIVKKLMFTTTFYLANDTNPMDGIPKKEYELTNGLMYKI